MCDLIRLPMVSLLLPVAARLTSITRTRIKPVSLIDASESRQHRL